MATYTIETTYLVPVYRQHVYEAESLEDAIRQSEEDDIWDDGKTDWDCARPEEVTGAWLGEDAYVGPDLTADYNGGLCVRHDMHGFYVCTLDESAHEDDNNPSVGFDGRPHFATIEAAWLSTLKTENA